MKKTKVLASILLAVVFILSMTTSAFAATVVNNSGLEHDYFAYQVFKGTQNPNTGTLGDIDWGNGVNSVTLLAELNANNADGQTVSTADEIAKLIPTETDYEAKALSKIIYRHIISDNKIALPNSGDVNLDPGYYLIVDESDVDGKYDANNMALLQLTDTITIADKTGTPTVQKRVFEQSLDSGAGKYNDVADYSIGENIKFKFNVNLPENIENFKGTYIDQETGKSKEKGYFINLHDKMSAGLTLNEDSFVIKVDGVEVGSGIYPIIGTPDAPFEDDCTFEIGSNNIFKLRDTEGNTIPIYDESVITVEFTAKLNKNAVIGGAGNENSVYLEFSNNPNDSSKTGETPEDSVVVFTYELDINKVDKDNPNKKLEGAEFRLMGANKERYAKFDNGQFAGWVSINDVLKEPETENTLKNAVTIKTDADGKCSIQGLDEGTYYLQETKAPSGYNTPTNELFKIVITASTDEVNNYSAGTGASVLTTLKIKVGDASAIDGDASTGTVTATIKNALGELLPETGGIGTVIFYIAGGVLLAGAIVLIIVKKRRNS